MQSAGVQRPVSLAGRRHIGVLNCHPPMAASAFQAHSECMKGGRVCAHNQGTKPVLLFAEVKRLAQGTQLQGRRQHKQLQQLDSCSIAEDVGCRAHVDRAPPGGHAYNRSCVRNPSCSGRATSCRLGQTHTHTHMRTHTLFGLCQQFLLGCVQLMRMLLLFPL